MLYVVVSFPNLWGNDFPDVVSRSRGLAMGWGRTRVFKEVTESMCK